MSMTAAIITVTAILAVLCYFIGSFSSAIVFTKVFKHVDVRDYGSKSAGMTNVLRTAGKLPAFLTLICDIIKGAICVILGRFGAVYALDAITGQSVEMVINPLYFAYIAGFFCMVGHIYPIYYQFRGGKGVALLVGVMPFIDWRVTLIALAVFLLVLAATKIVSISSMLAASSLPVATFFLYNGSVEYTYNLFALGQKNAITLCALCYTLVILFTHRANIVRLIKGEEKRIGAKK